MRCGVAQCWTVRLHTHKHSIVNQFDGRTAAFERRVFDAIIANEQARYSISASRWARRCSKAGFCSRRSVAQLRVFRKKVAVCAALCQSFQEAHVSFHFRVSET